MAVRDPRVDEFIAALTPWQRDCSARIRELIHDAVPEIEETIKRTSWPFFVLDGNVCAFQSTKDHLNVLIYDPIVADPHGLINQGLENKTARAIQIYADDVLDDDAFKALIRAVAANNRAGGWRKISQ
jgi:hypothetical protein